MFHFYTPEKTSENRRFFDVFRGYRSGILVKNGLILEVKFGNDPDKSNCQLPLNVSPLTFTCSKSTIETLEFKVNNKTPEYFTFF